MSFPKLPKKYNWVLIVLFFTLSIINTWFGLLGFLCMGAPMLQGIRGNGRRHCTHHCPRGSFLGTFMTKISLNHKLPKFMLTKNFRHFLLIVMVTMFSVGMYHAWGNPYKVAFTMFRFMGVSFMLGIVMGIWYKGKSWCAVCPMGHASVLLTNLNKQLVPEPAKTKKSA